MKSTPRNVAKRPSTSGVEIIPAGLIVFDLCGHSAIAAHLQEEGSSVAFFRSRKELRHRLNKAAAAVRVRLHHWAGDGGLFVAALDTSEDARKVCDLALTLSKEFCQWRHENAFATRLQCRITATYIPTVYCDDDPGNWYSPSLNKFLKHERSFGSPGTVTITQELFTHLEKDATVFSRPNCKRRAYLPSAELVWVYRTPVEMQAPGEEKHSFRQWLFKNAGTLPTARPTVAVGAVPDTAVQIGDSTIVDAAPRSEGYKPIVIETTHVPSIGSLLNEQDLKEWRKIAGKRRAKSLEGPKCGVCAFNHELLDDYARLVVTHNDYSDASAFHEFLLKRPEAIQRYWGNALVLSGKGPHLPGILCNHVLVVLGAGTERSVLLSHRKRRMNGYSAQTWSVSCEEQFNPVSLTTKHGALRQDMSIDGAIRRCVDEEFIGSGYDGTVIVRTMALQLEACILNYGFIGLVELPELTFDSLCERWKTADDVNEHDCLAELPLARESILECLRSSPMEVVRKVKHTPGFGKLDKQDDAWHPTSRARLALALWLSEQTKR